MTRAGRQPDPGRANPGGAGRECPPAPPGFRLRPDPGLQHLANGTVLLGGSPPRLIRLGPAGARRVAAWWEGEPVPDGRAARTLARRLLESGMAHPDLRTGHGREQAATGPGAGEVTIVVPARDRLPQLRRCLAGLAGNGQAQVIVVDDGSAEPAGAARAAAGAGARYLRREVAGGPAAARNAGLAAARTPLVAFIDSDCVPRPGWLGPLLRHFTDPAVGAVAPRIAAHPADRPRRWLARYEETRSALDMGPAESIVRPGAPVPYVPAAALAVRRAAAGAGFAEDMQVGEDVDFVWRLAAGGWQVRYEPAVTVGHQHRVRLREWFGRRRDYGTSAAPLELRHPGTVPAVAMSGWTAAAWLAAVLGYPEAGAAITGGTTALLARRLAPYTGDAWPVARRLAGGGTIAAGRLLGTALVRAWLPVSLPAAVAVRRLRLPLAVLVLASPVLEWRQRRPAMDPVRYAAARLADDVAYCTGLWQGCIRYRTVRPLIPRLWWWSRPAEPGGPAAVPRSGWPAPPVGRGNSG
jgi:mycofactocin glycosyltransferase